MKNAVKIFCLICMLVFLSTCKKDEPQNRDFDPVISSQSFVGVNTAEIGGSGLKLLSSRDDDSPLSKSSFNTVVSKEGEQLLIVTDANDKLRALTLSTPFASGAEIMKVDLVSTASSLIFITPGILTLDAQKASETIKKIQSLSSFSPFKSYLKSKLITISLNDIVQDTVYSSLLTNCVEEYINKNISLKNVTVDVTPEKKNLFTLELKTNTDIELKNYAYRYVCVAERDLNSSNSEVTVSTLIPAMKGAVPISWGSIFTQTELTPTTAPITFNPTPTISYSEFWVIGFGLKTTVDVPPASIKSIETPYIETIVDYIVFPMIDLISGSSSLLNQTKNVKKFKETIDLIKVGKNTFKLSTAIDTDPKAIRKEILNLALSIIGPVAVAYSVPGVGPALACASAIMGSANLVVFTSSLFKTEPYCKFTRASASGPSSVPAPDNPQNNAVDVNVPVTLSWKQAYNSTTYEVQVSKSQTFDATEFSQAGITTLTKEVSSLQNGKTYYWRVRSANSNGNSAWSAIWSFNTIASKPTVTTAIINNAGSISATVGGNVTDDGGAMVSDRGVFWSLAQDPETTGTRFQLGSGTGEFTSVLSGLTPGKTYYIKAYAFNSKGSAYGAQVSFTTAQAVISAGKISGIVRDAVTSTPLSGVTVTVYLSGTSVSFTSSLSDGRYEINVPANTGYKVVFGKTGYLNVEYQNVNVTANSNIILEPVLQIDQTYAGNGNISGTIKNALDGTGLSGVSLNLRSGINVNSGTIIASTITGTSGTFTFTNISAGNYTVEATISAYNTTYFSVMSLGGQTSSNQDASMSPVLASGEVRIVLTWGASPSDLDSHLTGPLADGSRFHMFYINKGVASPWPGIVNLDLDDVTSYGPETTTLFQQINGTYRFSVHDFTDRSLSDSYTLSNSGAQVKLYNNSGLVATYNVPPSTGGTLWTVFEINGSIITTINQMTYSSDPGAVTKGVYNSPDAALFNNLPNKY